MQKRSIIAVCLVLAVIIVAVAFTVWRSGDMPFGDVDPVAERRSEYTTSVGCRECHAEEYNSWHDSFHRTMTQEASADSVVAPFDDVTVSSRGRSFRFYKRGDEFRVQMMDITSEAKRKLRGHPTEGVRNLPENDRQIVMTTGSHHHQVYWVKGAGNEFKQVPFVYHIATKQWIPNEDSFLQPDSDEHQSQRWNDNCIVCHTVAGRPGFEVIANANNPKVGRFNSSFVELGIACEACHGPGDRHAEAHRRSGTKSPGIESTDHNPSIINPARLDSHRSAAICGQCHAHFVPRDSIPWNEYGFTTSFRPGELLDESRVIVRYNSALKHSADMKTDQEFDSAVSAFWKDGTHRVGGREYNGLIESGCYQRGKMSCLSCHSMHDYSEPNDQLSKILNENETCLQCHNDFADRISEHTHHKAGSSGSLCYNCHMPHTTFALFKGIRSHRIDSPNSQTFVKSGRPNACNLCHLDQTLQWTVDNLQRWYGQPHVPVDQDNQKIAASILWMLKGDAAQRAIVVWSAGWKPAKDASNDDWTVPYVAELLVDPYAAIRFMAARTLETSNVQIDSHYSFIGPRYERESERQRFIDAWQDSSRETQPNRNQRLLFDTTGRPIRNEVDRLIRLRSDKQIVISE